MATELEAIPSEKYQSDKEVYKADYNTQHTFRYDKKQGIFMVEMSTYGICGYLNTKAEADKYAMTLAKEQVAKFKREISPSHQYIITCDDTYTTIAISYKAKILFNFYDSPHILATVKIYEIPCVELVT
jgi:hypothetical protein